ncbi:MAG TPA: polysaccharide deacetylase family protein [Lachnospiraceae bacterium]|nr:polysaccharide deacetylase family protein [Lachnospiraceae bacterium]
MRTSIKRQKRLRNRMVMGIFAFAAALCTILYFTIDSGTHSVLLNAEGSENELVAQTVAARDLSGWDLNETGWRYKDKSGVYCNSSWETVEGKEYYFNPEGYVSTGWTEIDGNLYDLDAVGQKLTDCWVQNANSQLCRLGADGKALTGWFTDSDGRIFYMGSDHVAVSGWQDIEGVHYYMGTDGAKVTGWATVDGKVYYLGANGAMATGWQDIDGSRYYLGTDGVMETGLASVDGKTYDLGTDGKMVCGLTALDGRNYYFDDSGVMQTGWVTVNSTKYYFDTDGKGFTGWHKINDTMCFFTSSSAYDASQVYTNGPKIALTFDDGPGIYTNQILDVLEENNAKATFFMIGEQVSSFSDAVKREHDLGMEQGNHTWDHTTLTHLDAAGIQDEINKTNSVIASVTGANPTLMRPPGGGYNDLVKANSCGMPLILWSIDTLDWSTKNAQSTYDSVMNNVKDGDVILMHEIYQASLDAAKMLIPALIQQGYQLVTVSDLAASKGTTLTAGTVYGAIR